jgi:EAL domain-containing protein (putative c-di-GMP-specific phosphodiesterase class I)
MGSTRHLDLGGRQDPRRDRRAPRQHLVSATVQLARGFGQKTVAEGVKDTETLERLRKLEIDFVQGYYLGHPEVLTFD